MKLLIPRVDYFIKLMVGGFFRQLGFALPVLSKGFYPLEGICLLLLMTILINSYLAVFNLIPIPPLDGSGILMGLIPESKAAFLARMNPWIGILIVFFLAMTAVFLFLTVKVLNAGKILRIRDMALLGMVAGFAILAKVTPLILIPVVGLFILSVPSREPPGNISPVKAAEIFVFSAFIVSGWFFIRNWIVLGKPFYGGWDPSRKIVWWQEPGYRIMKDYYSFGEALKQPVYATFYGFADALYSTFWGDGYNICEHFVTIPELPHWNYVPLAAGIALSVVPAIAIAIGIVLTLWCARAKERWPFTFLLVSIGIYFAALVHLYTILPTFSTVKASYTMGLTPCYAAMAALGSELFLGKNHISQVLISIVVCWGIMTCAGFFIL